MKIKTKKIISAILFAIMTLCCLMCALKVTQVKADVSYTVGNALTADEYNIRGGSIKYNTGNNDNGMRIHIRMAASYYSALGSKEAGVLIIPEYDLGENQLDYNTDNVLNVPFIADDFNAISSPTTGESANDKEVLTSLIFRQNGEPVSSKIYNAVFCVRGYVIDGDTIRYTPVWKKAIADVALAFIDDPSQSEHSEELNGYLNTYQVKFFEEDGTTQIGETQNVKYGSTLTVENPATTVQYTEYNRKQSNGTFASVEYDFDAADATVVKKNMHFKVIVHDRTITYGEGISVKDSSGNPIASGAAVTAGDYTVTYGDSDKNHITTLYQDGTKQGAAVDYSVNGTAKYVCTVEKASVFTTSAEDYYNGTDKKFTATSAKTADAVNARAQGWDEDGYLYGPDINEFSVTPELRMAYDAVFTTKIAFNAGGYNTGVRIAVGSTECRIMGAPNFSGSNRNNFVQIANGVYNGSLTSVNYRLDANVSNNEADIKLIFDDTNNKIYVFVSGQDFTDKVTITYQPTEDSNFARVQLFNACLTGQVPAKFKDWSVNNGADAVAAELAKEYKTYTTSAVIGDYLGMINVSSNVKNNDDESTIFDAVITGESGFKAGVLFSDFTDGGKDVGFYVTENKVYGGANKNYSITSSLTHRLTLKLRNSGAIDVYVDGELKTGQFMEGFTTGASRTATYHCYLDNTVAKSVTFSNYHFGNHSSVNSS